MEIFFAIISILALILLWDIYKQLRHLNDKLVNLLEQRDHPQATMSSIYKDLKARSDSNTTSDI